MTQHVKSEHPDRDIINLIVDTFTEEKTVYAGDVNKNAMKITVISSSETKKHEIYNVPQKLDISLQVMDITDINDLTIYTSIGDVVLAPLLWVVRNNDRVFSKV